MFKSIFNFLKNLTLTENQSITYFFPERLRVSYNLDAHHSLTFVCIFYKNISTNPAVQSAVAFL